MSETTDLIEQLKAQQKSLEAVAKAEDKAEKAKAAYRKDKTEKNRNAHREAATALSDARAEYRKDRPVTSVGGDAVAENKG